MSADASMSPDEMRRMAELLQSMPGIKSVDMKDVRRLVELLRESPEIGSIELKGWFGTGVVITRTGGRRHGPAVDADDVPARATPRRPQHRRPRRPPPRRRRPTSRTSSRRWWGRSTASPEPGADAYVKLGSRVSPGQTVCIIEAMKIMNEIEAEIAGVIREVLVEDAQPVEFGQTLFRVDPNG